jgi:hypothetical protein
MRFLTMVELGLLASEVPFGFGHLHSLSGSQPDEIGFELSHHGQDIEEQASDRVIWVVDRTTEVETHLADRELVGNCPCIGEGAGQPIKFRHNQSVALTASSQSFTQSRAFPIGPGQSVINVDSVCRHPKSGKAVALGCQVLLIRGHSGVSDE